MLKASENPPITWPEEKTISDFEGIWWVAHTRSRNEKALAHDLISKNINYFLPMNWRVRQRKGRKLRSLLPLFTGYLFLCSQENQRVDALKTNRIASLIEVKDQKKLLKELSQIEQALQAGASLVPHKYIKAGQRCRVIAGALAGLEGTIEKSMNALRLVLQVEILGRATSVEIDADTIELLD